MRDWTSGDKCNEADTEGIAYVESLKIWIQPCNLESIFAHRKMELSNNSGTEFSS